MTEPASAPTSTRARFGLALLLGSLTIMAPLSIDMYLSALPALATTFNATPGDAQLTLTSYFVGFSLGQAFYGPLLDRFGRKPPLYFGMGLFMLASFGCALAPSIDALIALRFLQAIGACSGGVVSRAMVRDLFTLTEGSRVYAMLALVTSIGPLLGPLLGGYILITVGWRAIFALLGFVTIALLAITHFRVKETYRPIASVEARAQAFAVGRILTGYWSLFVDKRFIGYALCSAFPLAGMFVYISGVPFVFIDLYDIPPHHFGWLFGGNALMLMTAFQVNGRLVGRIAPGVLLRRGLIGQCIAGTIILIDGATGFGGLYGILLPLAIYTFCMGFIMPNAMVLAMSPFGTIAGMASALLGSLQFMTGAACASVMTIIPAGTALPMTVGMAFCAFAGMFAHLTIVRRIPHAL